MEEKPNVLTKFTKFYNSYFSLDQPKIKMSLPSEFNDIFDSQIHPDEYSIRELSQKYRISPEMINFLAKRISNSAHILSLSGKCALDVDTANMWGIYADNGKGIALEFDYEEIAERFNSCYANLLVKKFAEIDKRIKVKKQALLEKLEFVNTKVGKRALINIYSNIISTENGHNYRGIYNDLLSGNVTEVAVELISPLIDAILHRPEGSGLFLHKIEYIENNIDWLYKSLDSAVGKERLFLITNTTKKNMKK
jgi:hypothetical protein